MAAPERNRSQDEAARVAELGARLERAEAGYAAWLANPAGDELDLAQLWAWIRKLAVLRLELGWLLPARRAALLEATSEDMEEMLLCSGEGPGYEPMLFLAQCYLLEGHDEDALLATEACVDTFLICSTQHSKTSRKAIVRQHEDAFLLLAERAMDLGEAEAARKILGQLERFARAWKVPLTEPSGKRAARLAKRSRCGDL